jgi:CHAT domain-containing protein
LHPTEDASRSEYYRIVTYKDDKPIGPVTNFYKNGKPQQSAEMQTDRPKEIWQGTVIRYRKDGSKETEGIYKKGKLKGDLKLFHPDGSEITQGWLNLLLKSKSYGDKGKFNEMAVCIEKATMLARYKFGEKDFRFITTISAMSGVYMIKGDYPAAEELSLELLKSFESKGDKFLRENTGNYLILLQTTGSLYQIMGNYAKQLEYFVKYAEVSKDVYSKKHYMYANALCFLALAHISLGKFDDAQADYQEAKEIYSVTLGKKHYNYGICINSMGALSSKRGDFQKAEELYLEALAILDKTKGNVQYDKDFHVKVARNNLAACYHSMAQYDKAEPIYLETCEKEVKTKDMGVYYMAGYSSAINNLALLYLDKGEYEKAQPYFKEAISITVPQILNYFPSLSENEKRLFVEQNQLQFNLFEIFSIAMYPGNPLILCDLYNFRLATKAMLFSSTSKIRQRILNSGDPAMIKLFNDWQLLKDSLACTYRMTLDAKQKEKIDERKLEEEANRLEKELSAKSEYYTGMNDNRSYSWIDVRNKLEDGEAAVEVILTSKKINDTYTPVYAVLIIKPDSKDHPDIVLLEHGAKLDSRFINYYRNNIRQKLIDEYSYKQFWQPIAEKLKGSRKIYFSSDGVYNQINLNTLYNTETGKYVLDEIDIQLVTSTKDLVTKADEVTATIRNATLFGYPDYNTIPTSFKSEETAATNYEIINKSLVRGDSSQRFFNGENIAELPGTKIEVERIVALLKKENVTIKQFMESQATEAELKNVKNAQVLHIATHGYFLSDQLKAEDTKSFAGYSAPKILGNPLLRSGLLLAGAKQAFNSNQTQTNNEDGVLTAYEAMNLNLDKTDLVIMSACETGLGVTSKGEGVYGLQRAFQVAGTKAVLMSLWAVSDEATQELMVQFYLNWLRGKQLREAFRSAQLTLREKYNSPCYWGAFVLVEK